MYRRALNAYTRPRVRTCISGDLLQRYPGVMSSQEPLCEASSASREFLRVSKRWELNTVLIVNTNNRTTVGLANNTGQR